MITASVVLQPNFPVGDAVDKMDLRTLMMTVVVVSVTILSIKVSYCGVCFMYLWIMDLF